MQPPPPIGCTGVAPLPLPGAPGSGCGSGGGATLDTREEVLPAMEVVPSPNGSMLLPAYATPKTTAATPPQNAITVGRCLIVMNSTLVGSYSHPTLSPIMAHHGDSFFENELSCVAWPKGIRCSTEPKPQRAGTQQHLGRHCWTKNPHSPGANLAARLLRIRCDSGTLESAR